MILGKGLDQGYLSSEDILGTIQQGLDSLGLDGKRLLVIIPDNTRTMPVPLVFSQFEQILGKRVKKLDYLVALGTHQPLDDQQLSMLLGRQVAGGKAGNSWIFNHAWEKSETFIQIGTIPAQEIEQISHGMLKQDLPVRVNQLIFSYDQVIICGPVFPHEVAGFSGGNKYFIPGIAGPEVINLTHWLGALITNYKIIGTINTPVRVVIDQAASMIKVPTVCFAFVVDHAGVAGLFFGTSEAAWREAARLSGIRHVIYKEKPYRRVISIMPAMYSDLWTAAKGMYKLEPVVEDGGEVIIYAPHVHEVSFTHGRLMDEIGYHCRDYFLAQWDKFKPYPGGVLAHSTHVTGLGTYDPRSGRESTRIKVTLATGIPQERCSQINLGYADPDRVEIEAGENREQDGILVVHNAGEILYRLKDQA